MIKKILYWGITISLIIVMIIVAYKRIVNEKDTDGMKQNKDSKVYYRLKNNETWFSWTHDGLSIDENINYINGIRVKLKSKYSGDIVIKIFSDNSWSNICLTDIKCVSTSKITAIRMSLIGDIASKDTVFYRIKNKSGWSKWYETNMIAGTNEKDNYIYDIEVKLVPKEEELSKYLKDYDYLGQIVEF